MTGKTTEPEQGISVAAATPNRIPNTPLPAPLPPHVPCLWIEATEGEDFVRASDLVCPDCGAAMAVDEDHVFPERNDYNGWLEGTVLTRCTANDEHDSEMRFRREHVALISAAVMEWAVDAVLDPEGGKPGEVTVLYRTANDPRVRLAYESRVTVEEAEPDDADEDDDCDCDCGEEEDYDNNTDAVCRNPSRANPCHILAYLRGKEWPNPLTAARQWIAHRGTEPTEANLREAVREAIREQVEEMDGMGIGFTIIDEGAPDSTYGAWVAALENWGEQQFRSLYTHQFRYKCTCGGKRFARDALGVRRCVRCGADADATELIPASGRDRFHDHGTYYDHYFVNVGDPLPPEVVALMAGEPVLSGEFFIVDASVVEGWCPCQGHPDDSNRFVMAGGVMRCAVCGRYWGEDGCYVSELMYGPIMEGVVEVPADDLAEVEL